MIRFLAILTMLAWALWFGGMIALIIFVIRLFNASHDVGVNTAPILFRSFANYQIAVGLIACGAGTFLALITLSTGRSIVCLFMIVALAAAILIRGWTYEMDAIRLAGHSTGLRFQTLHHRSSQLYTMQALLLLVAGIGWMITFPPGQKVVEIESA